MSGYAKLCAIAHWLALTVWIGALLTAGIAAVHTFSLLPTLNPTLPAFAAYPVEEHGTIAAGKVMAQIFATVDLVQFIVVPLTVLTLLLQVTVFHVPLRRMANGVRAGAILAAAMLFGYYAFALAADLNAELRTYWQLAESGAVAEAQTAQASFREGHRKAEMILGLNMLLLLIAVGASAAATIEPSRRSDGGLEAPTLLKRTS